MLAILSDIHGNLEALNAVLEDVERMKVKSIICLGDLVGYGPDPWACVEIAMGFDHVLIGSFDSALVNPPTNVETSHVVEMLGRLKRRLAKHELGEQLMEFLGERTSVHRSEDALFVFGSPRDPLNEYVFPEDIYDTKKMTSLFASFDRLCFCGKSHVPGVFSSEEPNWLHTTPAECNNRFKIDGRKLLCTVGSVGQPRNGAPRACYVLFDGEAITFCQVDYDIDLTISKIRKGDDDDMHGDRLHHGR